MIENKQTLTSIDISNMLEVHQIINIELHKGIWIRKKLNVWMANEITEKNLHGMIICASKLIRHENEILLIFNNCEKDIVKKLLHTSWTMQFTKKKSVIVVQVVYCTVDEISNI